MYNGKSRCFYVIGKSYCYVYTFDEQYKAGLLSDLDRAYEVRRLFLKDKCKTFTLVKEMRDLDFVGLGKREVFNMIYDYYVSAYHLGTDKKRNRELLSSMGYQFGKEIFTRALQGAFTKTDAIVTTSEDNHIVTRSNVDTHTHGIQLLHSVDALKKILHLESKTVKNILERLFRNNNRSNKKFLALDSKEFYAFIINNEYMFKVEFRKITAKIHAQLSMPLNRKLSSFSIPEQDFFKYDAGVKDEVEYLSNAYENYTSGYATSNVRSMSERLFEEYCDNRDDIDWIYKNGDSGQQYMSIVYLDGVNIQKLFYPDYIVKKSDGVVWVIETKGGESKGQSKNIDIQIENKFYEFKRYAEENDIQWGFVRDLDNHLYINNTVYFESLKDDHWVKLESLF